MQWLKASPTTVPEFSARLFVLCARAAEERQSADGLDQCGLGRLEDSIVDDGVGPSFHGRLRRALDALAQSSKDPIAAASEWASIWEGWYRERTKDRPGQEPWSAKPSGSGSRRPSSAGTGKSGAYPSWPSTDGMLWYQHECDFDEAQPRRRPRLRLVASMSPTRRGSMADWLEPRVRVARSPIRCLRTCYAPARTQSSSASSIPMRTAGCPAPLKVGRFDSLTARASCSTRSGAINCRLPMPRFPCAHRGRRLPDWV